MSTRALQIDILLNPIIDYRDGSVASAYTVYFYAAGTSTAKNVWTEKEKTNPYTSRTLGSDGTTHVYGEGIYTIVIKDLDGTTVYEWPYVKVQFPNISVVTKSDTYTATTDDDYILVNTAGGNVTINLYPAADFISPLCLKKLGGNDMIMDPDGDELIDGDATFTVSIVDQAVWLFSNGSTWYVANDITGMASSLAAGVTVTLDNEGLHIYDVSGDDDYDLIIKPGSTLTADRKLTLTTGDAARTITLGRNFDTEDTVVGTTITIPNDGLHILDTNDSHDLVITPGSDLSADRILTLTTGDAARTVTLSGNPTLADWFDQAVKTTSSPTFANPVVSATITIPNSGLHVLDTNASHDLVITPGSDLSADRILTLTTGDAARTVTLSGNPTLNDWFDQAVKAASSPTFAGLTVANPVVSATITIPNTGLHLLDTNASHDLIIKPGSDITGDRTLTITTGDASREITLGRDFDTENTIVGTTITVPNEGLHLFDTNSSHDLIVKPGSNLSADRILTITTGDAARTVTLSGNPTLGDWFDQAVKAASSPTFANPVVSATITVPNEGLHLLDTGGDHDLVIKPGTDLSTDRILTITTGDAARTITLGRDLSTEDQVIGSSITIPNTGLHLLDTNASHDLIIAPGSDLTADKTLTLTTGDSSRTVTISGNPTIDDWFDQAVKQASSPTFTTITIGGTALSATGAEINTACDGIAATAVEINRACDGITATAAEINTACDGVLATAAEINTSCDGATARNTHVHSNINLVAGAGLTGGGTLDAERTFTVDTGAVTSGMLKSDTGSQSGSTITGAIDIDMVQYCFFPNVYVDSGTGVMHPYKVTHHADTIGRFALYCATGSTYDVRWRYVDASDRPFIYAMQNGITGEIIYIWECGNPPHGYWGLSEKPNDFDPPGAYHYDDENDKPASLNEIVLFDYPKNEFNELRDRSGKDKKSHHKMLNDDFEYDENSKLFKRKNLPEV